jgi:hypothetical protein
MTAFTVLSGPSHGQAPPSGSAFYTAQAVRIDSARAPIIDGDLSDPAWSQATIIDEFYQRNPNFGEPATERTVLRIMYDENNLYIGVYSYDSTPDEIVVRAMARDAPIFTSDSVRVILDPGLTRRNGYSFQVSAAGGRSDLLFQNNSAILSQWDTIWDAKVQLVTDGWVAEYSIPFRSISYDPDQTEWGFDFSRYIRYKSEDIRWSSYFPTGAFADVSFAGTLTGIENVSSGLGLDVQVYGTGRYRHDWEGNDGNAFSGTAGGNLYYKITPALTGTLTFNPDFSDSPLDDPIRTSRIARWMIASSTRPAFRYSGMKRATSFFRTLRPSNSADKILLMSTTVDRSSHAISASSMVRPLVLSAAESFPVNMPASVLALSAYAQPIRPTRRVSGCRLRVWSGLSSKNHAWDSSSPMAILPAQLKTRLPVSISNTETRISSATRFFNLTSSMKEVFQVS